MLVLSSRPAGNSFPPGVGVPHKIHHRGIPLVCGSAHHPSSGLVEHDVHELLIAQRRAVHRHRVVLHLHVIFSWVSPFCNTFCLAGVSPVFVTRPLFLLISILSYVLQCKVAAGALGSFGANDLSKRNLRGAFLSLVDDAPPKVRGFGCTGKFAFSKKLPLWGAGAKRLRGEPASGGDFAFV